MVLHATGLEIGLSIVAWERRLLMLVASLLLIAISLERLAERSLHDRSRPRIHYLLPIDEPNQLFCKTLFSAFLHDFDPVLIAFNNSDNQKIPDFVVRKQFKTRAIHNYLVRNVTSPDDIVIMSDSYDVWWQMPADEVIRRYEMMNVPLLYSVDKECYPGGPWCDNVPDSTLPPDAYGKSTDKWKEVTRPRWLNSGLFIGRAPFVLRAFKYAIKFRAEGGPDDDQGLLQSAYQSGHYNISLDFRSEIFQTMIASYDDIAWKDLQTGEIMNERRLLRSSCGSRPNAFDVGPWGKSPWWIDITTRVSSLLGGGPRYSTDSSSLFPIALMYNNISSTTPAALHFNGGDSHKTHMDPYWPLMWWTRLGDEGIRGRHRVEAMAVRRKVEAGQVTLASNARQLGWDELCGKIMPLHEWFP